MTKLVSIPGCLVYSSVVNIIPVWSLKLNITKSSVLRFPLVGCMKCMCYLFSILCLLCFHYGSNSCTAVNRYHHNIA
uniref:Uncharacterized protein n=1 Tax=Arundo donax TaxID=35708 RepID=A0A0A9DHT9_ARUDO